MTKVKSIAIIGAGVAGVTTAKTLLARGYTCTVFERNSSVGGVWADGYSNFGLQVQRELYEFPDFPHASDTPDFTPGAQIREYLESYARHFGALPIIRFDTTVIGVCRAGNGDGWVLHSECGHVTAEEPFDFIVICIGLYSNKANMPIFPGQEDFEGTIIHISQLKNRTQLAGKRVAVIGFGKSATDAALESTYSPAAETCLIFRETHWPVPSRLLGILPFKWAMLNRLTSALLPLYYRPSMLERCLHTAGKALVWLWWRLVELLLIAQFGLSTRGGRRLSLIPSHPIEFDAFNEAVMLPRPEFYRSVRNGAIEPLHTEIEKFTPDGVMLKNGIRRHVDLVIFATGWNTDYTVLDQECRDLVGFEEDGMYLFRQILPPQVPDLAFIGYAATIASALTYNLQARWLADVLDSALVLPARETMVTEVTAHRAWKRECMPFSSGRAARLLLHMLHYHDELLVDLHLSPLRKKGWAAPFKEVFAPYQPSDYRDVVS